MKAKRARNDELTIANDYIGMVAVTHNARILVDTIENYGDGCIAIVGHTIKPDGTLAKTVRYGTFPHLCTFEEWRRQ